MHRIQVIFCLFFPLTTLQYHASEKTVSRYMYKKTIGIDIKIPLGVYIEIVEAAEKRLSASVITQDWGGVQLPNQAGLLLRNIQTVDTQLKRDITEQIRTLICAVHFTHPSFNDDALTKIINYMPISPNLSAVKCTMRLGVGGNLDELPEHHYYIYKLLSSI